MKSSYLIDHHKLKKMAFRIMYMIINKDYLHSAPGLQVIKHPKLTKLEQIHTFTNYTYYT